MMSEKEIFKWNAEGKKAFDEIKNSIALAPTLVTLDFKKDFIIYFNASEHTLLGILTQINDQGNKFPITFMSVPLKKHELNYSLIEKQAFVVVNFVKQSRYYILHSHTLIQLFMFLKLL